MVAVLVVFGVVALVGAFVLIGGYNKVVALDEQVDSSWAQVENVLQRRYDLIPNLVNTVKGYAEHENEIFTQIARSRERYFTADTREGQIEASRGLERALSRLLVLQERYPDLKAQQNFTDLMVALEGTENRISVERKRYNDAVERLNRYIRGFFGRAFASWAGVASAEYFNAVEGADEAPVVDFSRTPATGPAPAP